MAMHDRKFAIGVFLAAGILAVLPFALAYFFSGEDHVFAGAILNPIDGNTYFAKAYQGWRGEWRFRLPYTAEAGSGAYINLYYILIGHVARWTGLSIHLVYQSARLISSAALVYALQRFFGRILTRPFQQNTALALSVLGLGMGWLAVPFDVITADFWVAEAIPLLAVMTNPHFPLGLALIVWLATPSEDFSMSGAWTFAGLSFVLSLVSPFGVVIALLPWAGQILGDLYRRLQERRLTFKGVFSHPAYLAATGILVGGAPVLLYDYLAIRGDPVLSAWDAQNLTTTPPWWDLLLSFSPGILLAWVGWRRAPAALVSWFILGLVLIFLPFELQRRFMMGLQIPVAGMAAVGLDRLREASGQKMLAPVLLTLLVLPGTLLLAMTAAFGVISRSPLLFLEKNEFDGLMWITDNTPDQALVFASPEMGLFIPAQTGRRVIYGHPFETVGAARNEAEVVAALQASDPESLAAYLQAQGVDYVYFGPREAALRPQSLVGVSGLRLVYDLAGVAVYQVLE